MTKKSNRGGLRNPPGGRPLNPNKVPKVARCIKLRKDLDDCLRQEKNATEIIEHLLTTYYQQKGLLPHDHRQVHALPKDTRL
jgi:predicted RNase H-like HicB family nuclease